jgi:hypothetical protein
MLFLKDGFITVFCKESTGNTTWKDWLDTPRYLTILSRKGLYLGKYLDDILSAGSIRFTEAEFKCRTVSRVSKTETKHNNFSEFWL